MNFQQWAIASGYPQLAEKLQELNQEVQDRQIGQIDLTNIPGLLERMKERSQHGDTIEWKAFHHQMSLLKAKLFLPMSELTNKSIRSFLAVHIARQGIKQIGLAGDNKNLKLTCQGIEPLVSFDLSAIDALLIAQELPQSKYSVTINK